MSGRARHAGWSWLGPCEVRNETAVQAATTRGPPVADSQLSIARRQHGETFGGGARKFVVRQMGVSRRRRGAAYQGGGHPGAPAAGTLFLRVRRAAGSAKTAAE